MTINNIIGLLQTAVGVSLAIGLGYTVSNWFKTLATSAKNERVKFALTTASQVVLKAQEFIANGSVQQSDAVSNLLKRIKDNGYEKYFTEEQALAYVKQAYATNKANGTLVTVKSIVADDKLKEAEAVVTPTNQIGFVTTPEAPAQ
ncbi:holin [Leuconostoc phage LDG]|uniref:Holin n=1 Tax=Leuconostoc phage LDG TaxID=1897539 RepID=A0A219VGB6_9CAUD|nr:holin [Leuconostoc phage LDG]AOQ27556.1 holin [Leuconostoc phage LDG]